MDIVVVSMPSISLNPVKGTKLKTLYTNRLENEASKFVSRYNRHNTKDTVEYVYSRRSKVLRGTRELLAVRLKSGTKGWISQDGRFVSQDSMYQLMMGLDGTVASGLYGFSFAEVWEHMSAQQRAEFVELTQGVDWDAFWEVRYSRENPLDEQWLEAFETVAEALLAVVG